MRLVTAVAILCRLAHTSTVQFFYTETRDTCDYNGTDVALIGPTTQGGVCAYRADYARMYGCPAPEARCWTWAEYCNEGAVGQIVCTRGDYSFCCNALAGEKCTVAEGQINVCNSDFFSPNSGVSVQQANKIYHAAVGSSKITATSQTTDPTPFLTSTLTSTNVPVSEFMMSAWLAPPTAEASTIGSDTKVTESPAPGSLSGGAIAGIVMGVLAAVSIAAGLYFIFARKKRPESPRPLSWVQRRRKDHSTTKDRWKMLPMKLPSTPDELAHADQIIPDTNTRQSRFSQRQILLITCSAVASLVLFTNTAGTIYLHSRFQGVLFPGSDKHIYRGSCEVTTELSIAFHALINILATALLSVSNVCMQLLVAPTRAQIDRLHRRYQWLDIGTPSLRNLKHVSWRQRIVWLTFLISSLPLHFLFNSAIYITKPSNRVRVIVATTDLLAGVRPDLESTRQLLEGRANITVEGYEQGRGFVPTWGNHTVVGDRFRGVSTLIDEYNLQMVMDEMALGMVLQRIDPVECLTRYLDPFSNASDAIMISSYDLLYNGPIPTNMTPLLYGVLAGPATQFAYAAEWRCGYTNTFDCRKPYLWQKDPSIAANWNIFGYKIDGCLVHTTDVENSCTVKYSLSILIVVCCMNAVKCLCICYTLWYESSLKKEHKPISVLGDAISSFLSRPDMTTKNRGLLEAKDVAVRYPIVWVNARPRIWQPDSRRWFNVGSRRRWYFTFFAVIVFTCVVLIFVSVVFRMIYFRSGTLSRLSSYGFGRTDMYATNLLGNLLSFGKDTRGQRYIIILFANMWQFFVSLLYFTTNALLTCICINKEWQSYTVKRKALRVSSPVGSQRSTYFVSLPARYALPMMGLWALLHWMVSQGLFLLQVDVLNPNGVYVGEKAFLGQSPWPLTAAVITGLTILGAMTILSRRKDTGALPLGATCSAVISAACHPPPSDFDAYLQPVTWGEVSRRKLDDAFPEQPLPSSDHSQSVWGKLTKHWRRYLPVPHSRDTRSPSAAQTSLRTIQNKISRILGPEEAIVELPSVIPVPGGDDDDDDGDVYIGHCSFTSLTTVESPTPGRLYE